MDDEHLQLAKRHSFPYMQVYTWNILKSGSQNEVEIQIPQEDSTPVINSDGTSEEREARLEAAILWIRKELSDMRHQDKYLTRQFIQLRASIQRIKSENSLLDGLGGSTDRLKEPSFRHSIPGPTLRPTLGRSISYM
ncbi:hypothetical protein OS493_030902 [Desmophyllum pertusum]|uniref:Uncharacterized protein n=1 Tax=Desmophyllum pertusum TaxID=174260 RepID=A0A9X0D6S1_9CNID|nr:hypothetical protein OS493_030902 [Desmophyllum pertusum]